jgi:hypothetical protein
MSAGTESLATSSQGKDRSALFANARLKTGTLSWHADPWRNETKQPSGTADPNQKRSKQEVAAKQENPQGKSGQESRDRETQKWRSVQDRDQSRALEQNLLQQQHNATFTTATKTNARNTYKI